MRRVTCGVVATTAGAVLAMQAPAEPVTFFNDDGVFVWEAFTLFDDGNGLDITQPATQSGAVNDRSVVWVNFDPVTSCDIGGGSIESGLGETRIVQSEETVTVGNDCPAFETFVPARRFGPGEEIDGTALWSFAADLYPICFGVCENGDPFLGEGGIVGIELLLDGKIHYGWVELDLVGVAYQPIAWGYETEPGVPIAVGCLGDVHADGEVDLRDVNLVLENWQRDVPAFKGGDVNGDGFVDDLDLDRVLRGFGAECE